MRRRVLTAAMFIIITVVYGVMLGWKVWWFNVLIGAVFAGLWFLMTRPRPEPEDIPCPTCRGTGRVK